MHRGCAPAAPWRLWALLPIVLVVVVSCSSRHGRLADGLVGTTRRPRTTFDVRRVAFEPGEIQIRVTNPQPDDLTIAVVTVDDAIVPFTARRAADARPASLDARSSSRSSGCEDEPIAVGVTSSTGIQTAEEIPAAVETPAVGGSSILGYALIGFLVGVVPIAFGLLWLPSLRRAPPQWPRPSWP